MWLIRQLQGHLHEYLYVECCILTQSHEALYSRPNSKGIVDQKLKIYLVCMASTIARGESWLMRGMISRGHLRMDFVRPHHNNNYYMQVHCKSNSEKVTLRIWSDH